MAGLVSAKSTREKVTQYLAAVAQVVQDFSNISGCPFYKGSIHFKSQST